MSAPWTIFRVLVVLMILGTAAPTAVAETPVPKTVLIFYDGGKEFPSIRLTDDGIAGILNKALPGQVTIFREYLDLTRISSPSYPQVLRDFYRSKYATERPDAIIAIRSRTLDFLLKPNDELFAGTPIISAGMDLRQIRVRNLPPNITGLALRVRYLPTIRLAQALQPGLRNVTVILGASPNDQALEALLRDELRQDDGQLNYQYLVGLPIDELLTRISKLEPNTAILFVGFARDGKGRSFIPNDILKRIASAANAPTYIASDDVLDTGVIGGNVASFSGLGADTAKVALRVLGGTAPSSIPFREASARKVVVDAKQLTRWGIPLSRIPPGATVINRTPSLWEAYGWWIVSGLSLIVLQAVLIGTLLLNRKRRLAAERNLVRSEEHRRGAVLEERNRMARDMHDTLAQGFTGVIVQLEAAKQAFEHGSSADTNAHIDRASELARYSLGEARRSIRALRPQALEGSGLSDALGELMKKVTEGTPLEANFTCNGQPRPLLPATEEHLLRIYQEILTNALKHSRAQRITATLEFRDDAIRLVVRDDGTGFDTSKKYDGLGLLGIRERVNEIDGKLYVESKPNAGTTISIVLPADRRSRAEAETHMAIFEGHGDD